MFRFNIIKPEIQEVIQEKEVSKESLKQVFFYNLLELERLRKHYQNLDFEIEQEKDLYILLRLGDRRVFTGESIKKRKTISRKILPILLKIILNEYIQKKDIDRWDYFILYEENKVKDFLAGKISYNELIKKVNTN